MTRVTHLTPEFVELAPAELKEGVLYVSMVYGSAVHKCCCGCGEKVVTPFSPTDWKLMFDGETISLHPSIGNWSFACRSHYWIRENQIQWAPRWSAKEVEAGRERDRERKSRFFSLRAETPVGAAEGDSRDADQSPQFGLWRRVASGVASAVRSLWQGR
jgi:hypothetical protein